jgi:putative glycosyl hydrolase-like family 6 (GHL6) protein/glycosyl hydrolase family 42 (putative beta-galactosidase)
MNPKHTCFNRRDFLKTSALLGVGTAAIGNQSFSQTGTPGGSGETWFDKPMRWAQLVLVENDPGQYDPQFWLDYFKRTHSDAACLSAGGIVAYYPTKVPLHHRSAWMKESDPFGELLAGCRKLNMYVLARTDPHAARQEVYDAHPDWIAVDAEGRKRRHWANPELWVTCALGPYNFEFMTEVHREIMRLYRVDGIFSNRWAGSGLCYCEHCQRNFRAASGMDLPKTTDPLDPARKNYLVWRLQRLTELAKLWDNEIRKINPQARYVPNGFPDLKVAGELADILFIDHQARRGLMSPWSNGSRAKEYRATLGHKPIGGIFSVGLEEPYRWKDSVQTEAEVRIWVAEGVAHGLRPWFAKFSGTLYDKRWLKIVEDIYRWHHGAERYLRNEEPLARVGMVYSEQTREYYNASRPLARAGEHESGMYQALLEARVPFEKVHDHLLDAAHLDPFKLLILPNIAALSDQQCQQLKEYVRRGGSLLATFETSLYDEWGVPRKDFGLAEMLGVSWKGKREGPMQNSYLGLNPDPATGKFHPVLAGLEDATRIINGVWRLDVAPHGEFPSPVTLIPSYPDLPMEDVFPRVPHTQIRELYLREVGKSRIAYFPWDIDRTFWEVLSLDHGRLLRNAVDWATNEEKPATVTGPGLLDVSVWRQKESMSVHLVNLTNPMTMKGPFRELIPLVSQEVKVRLPEGKKARKIQLLVSGQVPRTNISGQTLTVSVPSILDHEVVAIDL